MTTAKKVDEQFQLELFRALPRSVSTYEYIWQDGGSEKDPTQHLRCKPKVLETGSTPPIWGFDGSSTRQATGDKSDCVLVPVFMCPDPLRSKENKLVLCEVWNADGTPHKSNQRANLRRVEELFMKHKPWFGLEQEYTFKKDGRPLGFPPSGFPAPQGGYYCGIGSDEVFGAEIVEQHREACLKAGLVIAGTNAEVMPGQWEFQVGPLGPIACSDHLLMARFLLYRVAQQFSVSATLNPKPVEDGDWNGAGCHTNFSTIEMRGEVEGQDAYAAIELAITALSLKHDLHIQNYGFGIDKRLTGLHETCSIKEFKSGVSDRGARIRIPWQVARDRKGYIEDRSPCANMNPYVVLALIVETVCHYMDCTRPQEIMGDWKGEGEQRLEAARAANAGGKSATPPVGEAFLTNFDPKAGSDSASKGGQPAASSDEG